MRNSPLRLALGISFFLQAPANVEGSRGIPGGGHLRRTYGVQKAFEQWATLRFPLVVS